VFSSLKVVASSSAIEIVFIIILFFYTLGRYIPEGFEKKIEKLTNRYDTQSAQSNAGKQSWSRTALKSCNITLLFFCAHQHKVRTLAGVVTFGAPL